MRRRELILFLASLAGLPFYARAQQTTYVARLGILMGLADDSEGHERLAALYEGLHELGWENGKNVQIGECWGAGSDAGIENSAIEILRLKPNVIFVNGARALSILENHDNTVPVVMVATNDPRGGGFNETIARPATNVTGFSQFELSLLGKMLAQLMQAAPNIQRIGLLLSPYNPNAGVYFRSLQSLESKFGVKTIQVFPSTADEIDHSIEHFAQGTRGALLLAQDVFVLANRTRAFNSAIAHGLPTVGSYRSFAAEGGLMSYGADLIDLYRRAASYISRILHGEHVSDLPIQTPTKYELVINLRVAKTLGLTIPQTLLALADELIE